MQIFANILLVTTALCCLSLQLEAAKYNGNALALIKNSIKVHRLKSCNGVPEGHMRDNIQGPLGLVDLRFDPESGPAVYRTALNNGHESTQVLLHFLLSSARATVAIRNFNNNGKTNLTLEFPFDEIEWLIRMDKAQKLFPPANLLVRTFRNGRFRYQDKMESYVIIIAHQAGEEEDPDADILLKYAYPIDKQFQLRPERVVADDVVCSYANLRPIFTTPSPCGDDSTPE